MKKYSLPVQYGTHLVPPYVLMHLPSRQHIPCCGYSCCFRSVFCEGPRGFPALFEECALHAQDYLLHFVQWMNPKYFAEHDAVPSEVSLNVL